MRIIEDFIFFSIIGYIGEIIYCGINKRKSGKALRGPWCPLYGLGGLTILYVVKIFPKNIILIYTLGVIFASLIEYITSYILERIFHTRWWDYKEKKYNINGRICLTNSLLFGLLALILFYIYLPSKKQILNKININYYKIFIILIGLTMLIDGIITIIEAKELKKRLTIIENQEKLTKETLLKKLSKLKTTLNPNRLLETYFGNNLDKEKILHNYKNRIKNKKSKKTPK